MKVVTRTGCGPSPSASARPSVMEKPTNAMRTNVNVAFTAARAYPTGASFAIGSDSQARPAVILFFFRPERKNVESADAGESRAHENHAATIFRNHEPGRTGFPAGERPGGVQLLRDLRRERRPLPVSVSVR